MLALVMLAAKIGWSFNRVSFKINSTQCGDSRAEALAQSDPLVLAANATYQPKVHLIDMTDLYCTADFCPSVVGGMPVYRDSVGHTTATYANAAALPV